VFYLALIFAVPDLVIDINQLRAFPAALGPIEVAFTDCLFFSCALPRCIRRIQRCQHQEDASQYDIQDKFHRILTSTPSK
jgi:hypothetical protein